MLRHIETAGKAAQPRLAAPRQRPRPDQTEPARRPLMAWLATLARAPVARPLRAMGTGGLSCLLQLGLLAALLGHHWSPLPADVAAIALSTQVNFGLNSAITWHDRPAHSAARRATRRALFRRWAAYQGTSAGAAIANLLVFAALHGSLPPVVAAAAGTGIAALGNFVANDRLVFRGR